MNTIILKDQKTKGITSLKVHNFMSEFCEMTIICKVEVLSSELSSSRVVF